MKTLSLLIAALFLTALPAATQAIVTELPVVEWTRQLGTSGPDAGYGVSVDSSGNAYVTGETRGDLDGNINSGDVDMFLTKYDTAGTKLWTRQLGSGTRDAGNGVSVDSSGNAYVTGYTYGDLDGNTGAGGSDVFITKYDTAGTRLWTRQIGTGKDDFGRGVSVDSGGNVYVTGEAYGGLDGNTSVGGYDMFLAKYNTFGTKLWTRQLGTSKWERGYGVSVDNNGNAYVTGETDGGLDGNTNAGSWDIFLTKYDTDGNKQWTEQLGTSSSDGGRGVSVDSGGNAYVTGYTTGSLDANTTARGYDIFLIKYDTDGIRLWTEQLGTHMSDAGLGVSVDSSGNAYVTGYNYGGVGTFSEDVFLAKLDTNGNTQWTETLGTSHWDYGHGVSLDSNGNAYVAGRTCGGFNGNINAGDWDIFLVKVSTIPEPSTLVLLCMGVFGFLAHGWRRRS